MENSLFYIFSGLMILFGLLTITRHNPVSSALCLVIVFFFMAGLFVLLHAFFLAAIQILVYAGAIMVLFLFVIMLLDLPKQSSKKLRWYGIFAGAFTLTALSWEFYFLFKRSPDLKSIHPNPDQTIQNLIGLTKIIGENLFTKYLLPFEITSLLLLIAMIGVIILSKKDSKT